MKIADGKNLERWPQEGKLYLKVTTWGPGTKQILCQQG